MRSNAPRSLDRRGLAGLALAVLTVLASATVAVVLHTPPRASAAGTSGYWLMATDGGVFAFGQAGFYGSTGNIPLNQPIVGTTSTPSGRGYWMVASDGGIFAFGDAGFYGSMGGQPLNQPIVAMAPSPSGRGYWLVAADGGIFAFGDARFFGSMGGEKLNKPIVDIAATPTGRGYWMAATDGGIFSFGDAGFHGSTGDIDLALRIHAMAATPTGGGYWLVAGDGGIFAFGDAGFHGAGVGDADKRVLDIAASATGKGYYMTTSNGQVLSFGDAPHFGSTEDIKLNNRIVGMTAMNASEPPVAIDDVVSIDEDSPVTIEPLANDHDPDGGALTLRSVGAPRRGSTTAIGRTVLYQPHPDFHGRDSFSYVVADDRGDTSVGRVNVTIKSVDDKPAAVDDTVSILEDTPATFSVLANDKGLGDGIASFTVTDPDDGTLTVNRDRTLTYRPDKNFVGDDAFEYTVEDVDGDSTTGKVEVSVLDVDDVPVAADDAVTVRAGRSLTIDVRANDTSPDGIRYVKFADPAGNPTEAGEITTAAGGTAERADGSIEYSSRGVTVASDSFRYVIVDEDGDVSAPATVKISIGANEAPVANDAEFERALEPGESGRVNLSQAVSDPEDDELTFFVEEGPIHGELKNEGDGLFVYTAPTGGQTEDTFTYFVEDTGGAESNRATVTIPIAPLGTPGGGQAQSEGEDTTTTTAGGFLLPAAPLAALARLRRRRRRAS